jgi:hypothetical protein
MSSLPTQSDEHEYRLTWESIDSMQAAAMEERYGKYVWNQLLPEQWDALSWREPTVRVGSEGSDIHDQHRTLREWARTHDQPIRNVRLERRERPNPDDGWAEVDDERLADCEFARDGEALPCDAYADPARWCKSCSPRLTARNNERAE